MDVDDPEYITISDDDDVCFVTELINIEPVCINLTDSSSSEDSPSQADAQSGEPTNSSQTHEQHQPSQRHQEKPPTDEPTNNQNSSKQPSPTDGEPSVIKNNYNIANELYRNKQSHHQPPQNHQDKAPTDEPITKQYNSRQPPPNIGEASVIKNNIANELYRKRQEQHQPLQSHQEKAPADEPTVNQNSLKQPPPTDSELLVIKKNLGNEKYRKNLFNEAVRIYREAGELAKRLGDKEMSATLHFNLAMTYDKLGSFHQAADECASAVRLKDDYMKAHLKRAEIYERLRKFDEAAICWEHICELDSTNRDYAIRLSRVREAAKRLRKGCYYEVLGLNPLSFTKDDLKKAYKRKALTHHPDRHPDADIVTKRIQEKLFKDASEAHSSIQLRFGFHR